MNASASHYTSGCESGWTTYLDQQYSNSIDPYFIQDYQCKKVKNQHIQEDDEDLSMMSDASSGPPRDYEEDCGVDTQYYKGKKESNGQKNKTKEPRIKDKQSLCLDDTASSPIFQDNGIQVDDYQSMEHVPVFSTAHFEGESTKKHLGFFKSSKKGKAGSLMGRKRQ